MRFPKFRWSKALRNLTSDSAPHSNRHWANGLQRLPSNFLPMNINISLLSFKAVILHMRMYNSSCFLFFVLNTDKPLLQMDSACFYEERWWFSRENHSVPDSTMHFYFCFSLFLHSKALQTFSADESWPKNTGVKKRNRNLRKFKLMFGVYHLGFVAHKAAQCSQQCRAKPERWGR